jgi:hypothetical protein
MYALLFNFGNRSGWLVKVIIRPLYPPERGPLPIVQEAVWAPGPAWTDAESIAPFRIRTADRPVHSESLYRLNNPGQQ